MENKWCIKITKDNKKILLRYWKSLKPTITNIEFRGWLLSWSWDGSYLHYGLSGSYVKERSKEITLEEFQRDVLGHISDPSYEI